MPLAAAATAAVAAASFSDSARFSRASRSASRCRRRPLFCEDSSCSEYHVSCWLILTTLAPECPHAMWQCSQKRTGNTVRTSAAILAALGQALPDPRELLLQRRYSPLERRRSPLAPLRSGLLFAPMQSPDLLLLHLFPGRALHAPSRLFQRAPQPARNPQLSAHAQTAVNKRWRCWLTVHSPLRSRQGAPPAQVALHPKP